MQSIVQKVILIKCSYANDILWSQNKYKNFKNSQVLIAILKTTSLSQSLQSMVLFLSIIE